MNEEQQLAGRLELEARVQALPPCILREDIGEKARNDILLDRAKRQVRYLVWYDVGGLGVFSSDVAPTLAEAQWDRDGFIEDGYPARIVKLSVRDGQPIAEWIEEGTV